MTMLLNNNNRAALEVAGLNGLNVLDFDIDISPVTDKANNLPNIFSGKSAGAIIVVMKAGADPGASNKGGNWKFGTTSSLSPDIYPHTTGLSYLGWGTSTR